MKPFYITTTIPYVNADPHVGFALEVVQADALARYHRQKGHKVFFSCGTDEHGQKIQEKAVGAEQAPQDYVDHYAGRFALLQTKLNLSYDNFIRTTDPHHKQAAQEMWRRALERGDIYKKTYKGLYCVGDEMFVKESDLIDGYCPNHPGQEPTTMEEENYFFKLSKYQKYLEEYLSKPEVIVPEWRRLEALKFVQGGLEDFSISRQTSRMDWGVAVPEDDEHVMYVWFDALTNYVSTLGWPDDNEGNFESFWEEGNTVQLAGKDQVRFQSIMWQAMLKSAGLAPTDQVFYHGFITSGGQKMSKSIGNVVEPYSIVDYYSTDALRYFLLRHIHPNEDSDWTAERFHECYMANLVNGLGNLVNRVLNMADQYGVRLELEQAIELSPTLKDFKFNEYCDEIWQLISESDQYISDEAPFKKAQEDLPAAQEDVRYLLDQLWEINERLAPIMPMTYSKIRGAIEENKKPSEPLFPRLEFNSEL